MRRKTTLVFPSRGGGDWDVDGILRLECAVRKHEMTRATLCAFRFLIRVISLPWKMKQEFISFCESL